MIELRDKDKNRVAGLVDYENLCIESVLESGDKTLTFYYPKKGKYYDEIVEEGYIITKKDEFVVKARELDDDYTKFECSLNLEELEGTIFDRFESVEQTITSALNLAIVGTGWTVKDNTLKKRRTIRCTNKSSLEIVREIKKVYRVDIVFNTLKKQIEVYEHLGEDKGTYFIDSLNLIALQVQSDSRQYATRIIAEGKDGLSFSDINNGKNYVENYQYSNKVKTIYWKDERYSVKESLLEDARAKLEELSKPFRSYSASILNLAELNPRYSSILDFKLGDVINLISKKNKIKDKQRIVKIIEWPQDHTKDSVELANATLKFEDIQQENQETSDTVSNITTDNGTINGSTIDSIQVKQIENFEANVLKVTKLEVIEASINHLSVIKADIQELNVVKANIGTLEATKANITELNSVKADLQQAIIGKANITDLNAAVGKINVLESKTASIENALLGNLTAENFKANSIVAGSGIIADGAIGSAQISSLSVNKLEAGDITTSKHRIVSADGTIEIVGNQILINRNNINRVILGEYRKLDNTTDYGLLIRGKDGRTVMFDSDGVHNAGITDGAIDNNKVADNANISGNKLDINSVIREVNTHGTETIKGTKVQIEDRTLDVELSTQKNTITEHGKELSSQKATIQALDNAIKLKVDSQTFSKATETISGNINKAKQDAINTASADATNKANDALNSAKAFVNSEINTVNTHLNKNASEINILKGKIESKVSQSDIDKSISDIQIGGRNLLPLTPRNYVSAHMSIWNWGFANRKISELGLKVGDKITFSIWSKFGNVQTGGRARISFYDIKNNNIKTVSNSDMINPNEEGFSFVTVEIPPNTETVWVGLQRGNPVGDGALEFDFLIKMPKLEIGTKATDWIPAPEDLDQLIVNNIKTVTDKISTVESKLTQENNSIKASVRDLNSTTQSITTNVSNINRDLTNKINSNLNTAIAKATEAETKAKSYADSKKQEAINSANTHADSVAANKATEALNNAKSYTNAQVNTVNTKVSNVESNLNVLKDKINTKVSQSDIDNSISNITIGGRNLIKKDNLSKFNTSGSFNEKNNTWSLTAANEAGGVWGAGLKISGENVSVPYGNGFILSFEIKVPVSCEWNTDVNCYATKGSSWNGNDNDELSKRKTSSKKIEANKWVKCWSYWENTSSKNTSFVDLYDNCNFGVINKTGKDLSFEIRNVKGEIGNKPTDWTPAPEDVNQLIADNIKIVDSKISDVSSSVTQLRDSVTTQINSINSKTHSIETTLNGKASKQEVTEVNNRVATIKASLDSITQRVSSTESKTQTLEHNINDKASKQEIVTLNSKVVDITANLNGITQKVSATETFTKSLNDKLWETTNKLNNVEQRITPISIINTVSSAYYKKGEVDNVFSTKSEVEQLDNRINYKFSNTGYSNLIFNGNFANGTVHWRNWGNCSLVAENGQLTVRAKQSSNNANVGAVSSTFVLEKGKKYSLTFQGCSSWNIPWLNYIYLLGEDGVNHRLDLRIDINSADLVYRTATFTAPATKWVRLLIGVEGYLQTDVSGFKLVDVCLVEGDIPRRFVPNANEISEGATSIDSNGVIVRHTNGSYTSMTLGGFAWKTKNMEKAYHCLAETGWVNISTGAWLGDHYDIKITLPEYFRGKVFTPCSMIQGWYVESNFSLNQLVVNIPYETINYSEGSFVIRVKALTRDGVFQRNINISWLAIA